MGRFFRKVHRGEPVELWLAGERLGVFTFDRTVEIRSERDRDDFEIRWPGWLPPEELAAKRAAERASREAPCLRCDGGDCPSCMGNEDQSYHRVYPSQEGNDAG